MFSAPHLKSHMDGRSGPHRLAWCNCCSSFSHDWDPLALQQQWLMDNHGYSIVDEEKLNCSLAWMVNLFHYRKSSISSCSNSINISCWIWFKELFSWWQKNCEHRRIGYTRSQPLQLVKLQNVLPRFLPSVMSRRSGTHAYTFVAFQVIDDLLQQALFLFEESLDMFFLLHESCRPIIIRSSNVWLPTGLNSIDNTTWPVYHSWVRDLIGLSQKCYFSCTNHNWKASCVDSLICDIVVQLCQILRSVL